MSNILQNLSLNKELLLDHDRRTKLNHIAHDGSNGQSDDIKHMSSEVSIELPSSQQSIPSSQPELILRNVSDSSSRGYGPGNIVSPAVSSSPYDHIEEKWHHVEFKDKITCCHKSVEH